MESNLSHFPLTLLLHHCLPLSIRESGTMHYNIVDNARLGVSNAIMINEIARTMKINYT
jgi:hypothetical protein